MPTIWEHLANARDDIRHMLRTLVDIVVQVRRIDGQFRVTEIDYPAAR